MCWIYVEEIKLVFNTTEFLIMMAFDMYACSISAHFRFRFTFFFFFTTWLGSLLFSAVCVYSATLSLVERRALFACDTILKCWNVSMRSYWWVRCRLSHSTFSIRSYYVVLPTVRTWEWDARWNRTELMESVRIDVALWLCVCERAQWVSVFVRCACRYVCVRSCLVESKTSNNRFKMVPTVQHLPGGQFSKLTYFKLKNPLSIRAFSQKINEFCFKMSLDIITNARRDTNHLRYQRTTPTQRR